MKAGRQPQKPNAARAHDVRGKKAGKGKEHFVKGKNNEHLVEDNSEKSSLQLMHDKIQRKIYEADDVSYDSQSKKRTGTTAGYENPTNFEGEVKENCGSWKYSCVTVNEDGSVNKDAGWVPLRFYKGPGSWAKYQRYLADQKLKKEVSDSFDGITGMSWVNDMKFFLAKAEGEYGSIVDYEITPKLNGGGDMLMGAHVKTLEFIFDTDKGAINSSYKFYYFGYDSQFDLGYIYSGLLQHAERWIEGVKQNPMSLLAAGPPVLKVGTSSWIKHSTYLKIPIHYRNKFTIAKNKGIVGTEGQKGLTGILKVRDKDMLTMGYTHKVKILGDGAKYRLYGKMDANGHIIFDYLMKKH